MASIYLDNNGSWRQAVNVNRDEKKLQSGDYVVYPQMNDVVIFSMCRSGVEMILRNMGFKWDSSGRLFRI